MGVSLVRLSGGAFFTTRNQAILMEKIQFDTLITLPQE